MNILKIIPQQENSEIKFILYNFKNINKLIDKRKIDLIDTSMNFGNECWKKSVKNKSNTQENVILGFDEDYYILKLNNWNKIIKEFINKLQSCNNKIYFLVFKHKYVLNKEDKEITEKLNISLKKLNEIDFTLKNYLYKKALENQIFERGIQ